MTNTLPTFLPTSGGNTVPCHQVAGPLQIWVNTGASAAVEFLGWTRGGIEIQEQIFQAELRSDYTGGEQGPPMDFEWLGEMHIITAEMANFNQGILTKLSRRMNAGISARERGQLMECGSARFSALFISKNFARLYTRVFINDPISRAPIGSAAENPRITFTGLDDVNNTDLSPYRTDQFTVTGAGVTFSNTNPT